MLFIRLLRFFFLGTIAVVGAPTTCGHGNEKRYHLAGRGPVP